MRGSVEHLRYATPQVQLAWGFHRGDQRIKHVRVVDNGKGCDCICPACGEGLVARQGQVRAWHYGHYDGRECRNALSAAAAKFLAQWMTEGNGIDLPPAAWRYGGKTYETAARPAMVFASASAMENPETGAWEVIGKLGEAALRIIIRTNPRIGLPSALACSNDETSTLLIDLGSVMSVALEIAPELCTNEDWMISQLISEAPRSWIWNAAAQRRRSAELKRRLGPYLKALECQASEERGGNQRSEEYEVLELIGLDEFMKGPEIAGEAIFGGNPMNWRSKFFLEAILKPIASSFPQYPVEPIHMGWKRSGEICSKMKLTPRAFLRRIKDDDLLELRRAVPGFTEPVKLIDRLLDQLLEEGVLRARPRKKKDTWNSLRYDEKLKGIRGASHSVSPEFLRAIFKILKEHPEDRQRVLEGKLHDLK